MYVSEHVFRGVGTLQSSNETRPQFYFAKQGTMRWCAMSLTLQQAKPSVHEICLLGSWIAQALLSQRPVAIVLVSPNVPVSLVV